MLTLTEALQHDHLIHSFLAPEDFQQADPPSASETNYWWGDGGTMAPEVGLLTHNIVIQGKLRLVGECFHALSSRAECCTAALQVARTQLSLWRHITMVAGFWWQHTAPQDSPSQEISRWTQWRSDSVDREATSPPETLATV